MIFDVTKKYNREPFVKFLVDFLPDDFEQKEENIFGSDFKVLDESNSFLLGVSDEIDLAVYEFHQKSQNDPRVAVTKDAIKYVRDNFTKNNILAVFYNEQSVQWRFSLITSDFSLNDKGGAKQKFSNTKRFSFLLGEGCKRHTPECMLFENGRPKKVSGIEDLKARFSVEAVTKEFYNELFSWYEWAVTVAKFPEGKAQKVYLTNKNIDTHIIRLITRLMFVWFLKQKSLIPEWIFDEKELSEILSDFSSKTVTNSQKGNYYNAVIQNLFFATLNKSINERDFAQKTKNGERNEQYGIKTLYRDDNENSFFSKSQKEIVDLFKPVPFLNGGLFECLDKLDTRKSDEHNEQNYLDGFSREKDRRAFVPNCLFWNKEDDEHEGLISILNRYNFTVEENTPSDVTVALDPELLGKVFENLLGVYNPETQESARKDSGSFYTPREIVDYMVNESLTAYLIENGELKIDNEKIRAFVNNPCAETASVFTQEQLSTLKSQLSTIKILDPACGSGAFPMGILNRLVQLITSLEEKTDTYELKLNLIENCIYGIDIQNIAVQISKLRFFISLICEQDKTGDENDNYGFNPLPNLETKFVCANSLIGLKNSEDILIDNIKPLKDELHILREKHFRAGKSSDKKQLRDDDEKKRNEIAAIAQKNHCEPNEQIIKNQELELENLKEQLELVKEPKWVDKTDMQNDLFGSSSLKLFSVDENKEKRDMIMKEIKKCNSIIESEKNKKADEQFDKEIKTLLAWNPYDQNSSSPFFDVEWMFGITDGFDIVIGNPPYIQLQKNGGELGNLYKDKGFETFEKTGDIYSLFYEKGIGLLKPNAHLCYITSNKWMRAGYGESTRKFFAKNNPVKLIDFAGVKIFESATVDTNILLIQKTTNKNATECCVAKDKSCRDNLSDYIQRNSSISKFDNSDSWVILSPIEQSIKRKIEAVGTPLKDWDIQINYGIKTGCNEAFIISTEKRDEILANCKDDDERKRTEEIIRPILRGRDIKRYSYDWAGLWLINTHNGIREKEIPPIDIKQYPAIKAHLDKYWDKISARDDKGITPYNLRNCAYMDDFYKQKIIYPETTQGAFFAFDDGKMFIDKTCFMMICNSADYMQKTLSSKLFEVAYKKIFSSIELGEKAYQYNKHAFEKLPILKDKNAIIKLSELNAEEVNQKIYELYGLSSEEISFIESF